MKRVVNVNTMNRFRYEADTSIVPPLFAQKWQLATIMETSKNNDDYWNFEIKSPSVLDFESDEDLLELAATTSGKAADTPLLKSPKQEKVPALTTDEDIF